MFPEVHPEGQRGPHPVQRQVWAPWSQPGCPFWTGRRRPWGQGSGGTGDRLPQPPHALGLLSWREDRSHQDDTRSEQESPPQASLGGGRFPGGVWHWGPWCHVKAGLGDDRRSLSPRCVPSVVGVGREAVSLHQANQGTPRRPGGRACPPEPPSLRSPNSPNPKLPTPGRACAGG